MLTALLSLVLAGPVPVTIYVGPLSRDGFVDADTGVRDSVRDLRSALQGKKGLRLVNVEADADLKLYVLGRGAEAGPGAVGAATIVGSTAITNSSPSTTRRLETLLRVGTYERPFVVERNDHSQWFATWQSCANRIAKDVAAWVDANSDRVASAK